MDKNILALLQKGGMEEQLGFRGVNSISSRVYNAKQSMISIREEGNQIAIIFDKNEVEQLNAGWDLLNDRVNIISNGVYIILEANRNGSYAISKNPNNTRFETKVTWQESICPKQKVVARYPIELAKVSDRRIVFEIPKQMLDIV